MSLADPGAALRAVSRLRALGARLPHVPTDAEARRLADFEALAALPESATAEDIEALATGWRRWWRSGETARIREMAEGLPVGLVDGDRRLAGYARAVNVNEG